MKRLNHILEQSLGALTAISSMGFFVIVLGSILLRRAGLSMDASIELSRLSFVWSCFLAAAITYRRQAHVGFTVLHDRLPRRWRARCTRMLQIMSLLFLLLILVESVVVVTQLWPTRLPMLGISQAWLYLPLTVSSAFMLLFTLEFLSHDSSEPDPPVSPPGSTPA